MKRLTFFEIDLPRCANTYGVSPCTAALGVTGTDKCVNCFASCQDPENFILTTVTQRYAVPASYLPRNVDALPNITDVDHSPAVVGLGDNIGSRASLKVTFSDAPHSDAGAGYDPYFNERSYNPWEQGTHWGKFRARYPYIQGVECRLIRGVLGEALEEMDTRYFLVESVEGPSIDGEFSIVAKDRLKSLDGDRAQAPVANSGRSQNALTTVSTSITLIPAGVGDDEYDEHGYATLGGNEVVGFTRGGIDANALLALHFNGTDGQTSTVDSSSFARAITFSPAGAQLETDFFQFGPTSIVFDANEGLTVPDSNDWTFAGDFTIDCWVRPSNLTTDNPIAAHGTDASNSYSFNIASDGKLEFTVLSAGTPIVTAATAAGAVVTITWQHVAVVRSGSSFLLFVDGVLLETEVDSSAIPNFTGTFRIGQHYENADDYVGYIDELRVSNVARWTDDFIIPFGPYSSSGDTMTIVRAQLGTSAQAHDADTRVQQALRYDGRDVAVIIADLMTRFAGIDESYIPQDDWEVETGAFLNAVYTTTITEPTAVKALVSELIEQVGLVLWWSDAPPQVNLQVLRSAASSAAIIDEDIMVEDSLEIEDQPQKRASQVWTWFGQRNPTRPLSEESNYTQASVTIDAEAELNFSTPSIKKIYSRWIPTGGQSSAERVSDIIISRYRIPPRLFRFQLFEGGSITAVPATGYQIEARPIQGFLGERNTIPVQVVSVKSLDTGTEVTAEEFETDVPVGSGTDDIIVLSTDQNNVNLQTLHDQLYPTAVSGDRVICYINASVIVGSVTTSAPSFDVGSFAAGVTVVLIITGRVEGKGGNGGDGGGSGQNGDGGGDGGLALFTRQAISVDASQGEIWSGGGGGGGGGGGKTSVGGPECGGGGGGGGGGRNGGNGGDGGDGDDGGQDGSGGSAGASADDGGGARGAGGSNGIDGGSGGAGGDPGDDGSAGVDGDGNQGGDGGSGGDQGDAVDGNSFISYGAWNSSTLVFTPGITGTEDIRGPEIN